MTHTRETIKFSDRIMECLHVTYKKIFYKQAKTLSVSFWTTSPMNWLRATGTRKQYFIEENRTRPLCQWQVLGNSGHQRRSNYQGEILGIFLLDAWKNPKAATKKRGPKKSEPQTHRGPRGDWNLCFLFSFTWTLHWDYKGCTQFATRSPSSYFPLTGGPSVKASAEVLGKRERETACMRVSIHLDNISLKNYLQVYNI